MKKMQRERQNRVPRRFHSNIDSEYFSDYDYPSNQPRRLNRQTENHPRRPSRPKRRRR